MGLLYIVSNKARKKFCFQTPYGAPEHRKPRAERPKGSVRDHAGRPPGQGCPVGRPPRPRREAQGDVAPSGVKTPVGASRAPSKAGSFRETFDRARGAL